VIRYRSGLNTDPPAVLELWNEVLNGRGTYPIRNTLHLERWLYSKPYFDNEDVVAAVDEETNVLIGLSLVGHGPGQELDRLDLSRGVVCAVLVKPAFRNRGIGRELLRRAEDVLKSRGSTQIQVGSMWPNCPYLYGLYGGSNSPGILSGEVDAVPFLTCSGYAPTKTMLVMHKRLDVPLTIADTRFGMLRRRYDPQALRLSTIPTWWHECMWGLLEPTEIRLTDKLTGLPAARAIVWELEGFSWRWGMPSVGILDLQVRDDLRRLGLGKMLLVQVLRMMQDQFFAVAELQVPADDPIALGLCRSLGFDEVDRGRIYERPPEIV